MAINLLIADDDKNFSRSVETVLKNFNIAKAFNINEIKEKLDDSIDLILLDLVFDEQNPERLDGLKMIPYIKDRFPDIQIVVLTNYASTKATVEAIKAGASDLLNKKELNWTEWKTRLETYGRNAEKIRKLKQQYRFLENQYDETDIIGNSKPISDLKKRLIDLAQYSEDISILFTGETGTGKNLAVKYFRKHSKRHNTPYREFSVLELSESLIESELFGHKKGAFTGATSEKKGLFEEANHGILFLDEIGDYDARTQAKLLRFLDEKVITPVGSSRSKKLDIQLVLATNYDLNELVKEKRFREDLYQRINRVQIIIPPLRERVEDIKLLTYYFFDHFRKKEKTRLQSIDDDVIKLFMQYRWPGNIRELQSVIWDACTKARFEGDNVLQNKHLKSELLISNNQNYKENKDFKSRISEIELEEIDTVLQKTFGQKSHAAKLLGLNSDQLRYKVLKISKNNPEIVRQFVYIRKYYKL